MHSFFESEHSTLWLAWPHSLNCSRFAHCPVFGFSKLEKWTGQSLENINQVIILTPIYKLVKSWMLNAKLSTFDAKFQSTRFNKIFHKDQFSFKKVVKEKALQYTLRSFHFVFVCIKMRERVNMFIRGWQFCGD